jgi:hypothetical protein
MLFVGDADAIAAAESEPAAVTMTTKSWNTRRKAIPHPPWRFRARVHTDRKAALCLNDRYSMLLNPPVVEMRVSKASVGYGGACDAPMGLMPVR